MAGCIWKVSHWMSLYCTVLYCIPVHTHWRGLPMDRAKELGTRQRAYCSKYQVGKRYLVPVVEFDREELDVAKLATWVLIHRGDSRLDLGVCVSAYSAPRRPELDDGQALVRVDRLQHIRVEVYVVGSWSMVGVMGVVKGPR